MRNKRNMMNNNQRRGGGQNRYNRNGGGQHRSNYSTGMENEDSDFVSPRQRKIAMTQREKYISLGREAAQSGDRVQAEYFFQHADHYLRVINLSNQHAPQPQQHGQHQSQDDVQDGEGQSHGNGHGGNEHRGNQRSHGNTLPDDEEDGASLPLAQALPAPKGGSDLDADED